MSLSTVFTFLSKAFAKISIAFSLFFVVLAASYYFGVISDTVFNILFLGILIMVFIDVIITFVLAKDKAFFLHGLEKKDIRDNYQEWKKSQIKIKKAEDTTEGLIKGLGLETATKVIKAIKKEKKVETATDLDIETVKEELKRAKAEYELVKDQVKNI